MPTVIDGSALTPGQFVKRDIDKPYDRFLPDRFWAQQFQAVPSRALVSFHILDGAFSRNYDTCVGSRGAFVGHLAYSLN